jgi:hypothetical protein
MSADREDQVREGVADMDKSRQEMEEQLSEVESDIAEAKDTAAQRQDAPEKAEPMEEWDDSRGGGEDAEQPVGPDGEPIVESAGDDATVGTVTEDFAGDEAAEREARKAEGSHDEDQQQESDEDEDDEPEASAEDEDSSDDDLGDVDVATPET